MSVLYVVATPVGNLKDLSPRGTETLRGADLIIAEDTRTAMKLCQVFDIHARLESCHRHNEKSKAAYLAEEIKTKDITAALTTDAGTPCISDPGYELVRECISREIAVIPVPGCCAAVAALSVCGFDVREFTFRGFLPREKKDLTEKLNEIGREGRAAVIYESPFRIIQLVEAVCGTLPSAELAVCCDLTKLHEKTIYGSPDKVLSELKSNDKTEKGEYCVVLKPGVPMKDNSDQEETEVLSLEAAIVNHMKNGCSLREAQDMLTAEGKKKNAVKQAALNLKKMFEAEI